jgi:hypothetical protein
VQTSYLSRFLLLHGLPYLFHRGCLGLVLRVSLDHRDHDLLALVGPQQVLQFHFLRRSLRMNLLKLTAMV